MALTASQRSLALDIFDVGAFQDKRQSPDGRGFRLKLHEKNPSAPLSPFYLNLRTPDNPKPGPLTPELVEKIGRQLRDLGSGRGLFFNCVAGLPNAGDPLAQSFSAAYGEPSCLVIKLRKGGTAEARQITRVVSDKYHTGDTVLVIDDLITAADTKLEGIAALREAGLKVRDVVVVLDREQGGARQLAEKKYKLHTLLTITELLCCLLDEGRIPLMLHYEISRYLGEN